jgi:hypothetical protein
VHPFVFFSSDDVSSLLNKWDKPKLISTAEAQEILRQHNISVSVTEDLSKQRVITFNFTFSGGFKHTCKAVKIFDRNFPWERPRVFRMGNGLYYLLYHPSTNESIVAVYLYQLCIIPEVRKVQKECIERI